MLGMDDIDHPEHFDLEEFRRHNFSKLWKEQETELNRLYSLGNKAREADRERIEELELAQDRIEWQLGREAILGPTRKWSGMP
jgi:hypothetical protein